MTSNYTPEPERYRQLDSAEKYNKKIKTQRRLSTWLELKALERALGKVSGTTVLDAPCGTGRIDGLLRQHFADITGLDSSNAMLEVYRSEDAARKGLQGDIFNLPFPDRHFDWVVSHRLFHHFDTDELRVAMLKSTARVAREGIVFYAWIKTPFSRRDSSRRQTLALDHVKALVAQAGLDIVSIHYASWPFQPKATLVCRKR